ncbi:MAG: hypothetical protein AAF580_16030, partial [Pseudomonadota bacterium]
GATPQEPQVPPADGAAGSKWAAQAPSEDAAESIDPAVFPSAMAPEVMTTAVNLKAPALDGVDDGYDDGDAPTAPSFLQDPVGRLKPLWYTLAAIGTVALVVILFRELNAPDDPIPRQPVELTPPVHRQPEQDQLTEEPKPTDAVGVSDAAPENSANEAPPIPAPVVPKPRTNPIVTPKPVPVPATPPKPSSAPPKAVDTAAKPPQPPSHNPGFDPKLSP